MKNSVTASIEVRVDPETAFRIYTEEINSWWDRGPTNFYNGARAIGKRFELGMGGRYLEIYDDRTGDVLEIGRITHWEPGRRFVYRSAMDDTEVDIRFEEIPSGTRVVVEQRLVAGGSKANFLSGWKYILAWYADWAEQGDEMLTRDRPRISPILYYKDSTAAAWLARVFSLRTRHRYGGELMLGDSVVMLRPLDHPHAPVEATHALYVYVDNVEEHYKTAQAGGAKIHQPLLRHGDYFYVAEDLEGHRWTFAQARPTQRREEQKTG
jgi:uncharacterized glyoxalase superfamily protein PhnB